MRVSLATPSAIALLPVFLVIRDLPVRPTPHSADPGDRIRRNAQFNAFRKRAAVSQASA